MKKTFILILLCLLAIGANAQLKPRVVILTDIGQPDLEPDDTESLVHLLCYADMLEIEGIITSTGWNCDPYPTESAAYRDSVVEAYATDVHMLMKRSGQKAFATFGKENGKQQMGYWPSAKYIRSRCKMGSQRAGIGVIGKDNDSEGSELIIRLADENDDRPIWVCAWGGANTLAQAIWKVQQTRTPGQLKTFLHKLRLYTITDQDMVYAMRENLAYSSHQWMRREFANDLKLVWDEGAWQLQCELGKQYWQKIQQQIQGHATMGKQYPNYKYGVEGDTPSFLNVIPNGLHNPEEPMQAGWGGYHTWALTKDSATYAWTSWQEPVKSLSEEYYQHFYQDNLNDFIARIEWAEKGQGNHNPVAIVNGKKGTDAIVVKAKPGQTITLDASKSFDPDGDKLSFSWWQQKGIGKAMVELGNDKSSSVKLKMPAASSNDEIHIICEVHDNSKYTLPAYRRIIIRNEKNFGNAFAQGFKNPVLPGFHADPSVCCAGDDFYLVNSTFQYFPGVPVFHSKDLIHWEQVGNCLTRPSQLDLSGLYSQQNPELGWTNGGIYATTIRYNERNRRFYMVTTIFPSRRHFYVWTDDPAGEWSEPIVIDFAIGSCDPTLYFEGDKTYFLWKEGDIKICEIDVETGKQLGEIHHLGTGLGGRYPEGPHIYKKDGFYYMMLAEGGTEHGHQVNILRSRNLFGPYESNRANPILSHFNMEMQGSEIQGLGHADLVQAPDSSWWMICLGYRTSGYLLHVMGRETMLAPVRWDENAWPVVNGNGTLSVDMNCNTLPQVPMPVDPKREDFNYIKRDVTTDSYSSIGLPWGWMSIGNPDFSCYSLTERKGWLRLHPTATPLDAATSPTFVARRQTEKSFTATTLLDASHLAEGAQTGITAYAAPLNHYDVIVENRGGKLVVRPNIRLGELAHSEKEIILKGKKAYLRITSNGAYYFMQVSENGKSFETLCKMDFRYLSTEVIGGFTGVMLGVFAQGTNKKGYADFDWFDYVTD